MSRSGKRKGPKSAPKQAGSNYEVGYGRPPVVTRFPRGGVGNPKGRPKKTKTVGQIIEEGFMTAVRFEENGRRKTRTVLEIIFTNLLRTAARGDIRATQTAFALLQRFKDSPETTLNTADLNREDREILEEYLAKLRTAGTDVASNPSTNEADQNTDENKATDGPPTGESDNSEGDAS